MSAATAPVRGKRKAKVGRVVSDKMDKTIVVSVERLARHRVYKRVIRLTTKFKAHDEHNEAHVGDTVRIEEARPLSATKRWRLIEVVVKAGHGAGEPWSRRARDGRGHPHGRTPGQARPRPSEAPEPRPPNDDAPAEAIAKAEVSAYPGQQPPAGG